jgi:Uma2 family endonuclease
VASSTTLISVNDYLSTTYHPDREYVDGELVERNLGEWNHSRVQSLVLKQLHRYEDSLGILVVPEQRVQVRASRFRVPDVCVVNEDPGEQMLRQPPSVCIEVLSPEDSMTSMQERIDDYLCFGVPNI